MWPLYKHHNTFKGLIGISPTSASILVSNMHMGGISDQEITRCSGLSKLTEPGNSVMAEELDMLSCEKSTLEI